VALAGHLPPVIVRPGRSAVLAEVPLGPPVGRSLAVHGRRSGLIDVPLGALVALFTDGLVERRDASIDDGLARLLSTVAPGPVETVCARVMATMVGAHAADDDIALLAARHTS
jgi:serine phosphatase RsbU (regulator of sigma subunit)